MPARRSVLTLLVAAAMVPGLVTSSPSYATEPAVGAPAPGHATSTPATGANPSDTPLKPSRNSTPPDPVTKLSLTGNDPHSISLGWINPADPDFAGVLIRRAAGGTPPMAASDGTLVAALSSGQTTFTDQHLTAATTYSYAVFGRDKSHNAGIATTLTTATRSTSTATGLRGELTDRQGRAISRAQVEVRDASSGNSVASALTSAAGQFSVTGLAPGSYLLCYQPGTASTASARTGHLPGCYRAQLSGHAATGMPVTVRAGQLTSALLDDAPVAGALSGRVTDSAGNGLPDVVVSTFDPSTPEYGPYVALTQLDGTYTVASLAAGSYQVCFHGQGASGASPTGYLDECYDDQPPHSNSAMPVAVNLGQTSTGVNAALAEAGAITGQVTDPSGAPVSDVGVKVWVYGASQFAGAGVSDSSGGYTAQGLPTGSYTVCFDGSYAVSAAAPYGYTTSCTDDVLMVDVVAGQATTFDKTVATAGAVGGAVTGDNGPVAGVWVSVHDSSGSQLTSTPTAGNGSYQFNGLASDQVTVCFDPTYTAGGYQRTCYGAQADGSGSPITVTAGQLSTADVQLSQGASITGTITDASGAPVSGVLVSAYGGTSYNGYYSQTDESGSYTVSGVTAENYRICFDPSYAQGPTAGGYAAECHDNQPSIEAADPVTVGTSGSVTVDAVLSSGAAITGQVTGSDGAVLGGVYAYAYSPGSGQQVIASSDSQDGSYRLAGLAEGDYTLCFDASNVRQPAATGYVNECHDNQSGALVHVAAGTVTADLDAELTVGASISGQVTDSAGEPIPQVNVETHDSDWGVSVNTDDTGHYRFTGLPAASLVVCFHDYGGGGANGAGYLPECLPVSTTSGVVSPGDVELLDAPAA
ncbi:MAG: carboxypeptidase regulatory-like domain-containing protein [Jatrophihabitantaceae bacterium]